METLSVAPKRVEFQVDPNSYRHLRLKIDGEVATIEIDIDENGGIKEGYELKMNSYDLGVDIELYDITQRLRFTYPQVKVVVVTSAKEKIFCAGANIKMLAQSSHQWKVNFCKFTNETRLGIEDATNNSSQVYVAALNGVAAGGGYELALACDKILLVDDRSSAVSLPEIPLLGVLPGTGGLTRVVDKRYVRRDLADYFATKPEGIGGKKALSMKLIDALIPKASFANDVAAYASDLASSITKDAPVKGIELSPLKKVIDEDLISYDYVKVSINRGLRYAEIAITLPDGISAPSTIEVAKGQGENFYLLSLIRQLDDAILELRTNEAEVGTWVIRGKGDMGQIVNFDNLILSNRDDWFANEVLHYLKRTLKRFDVTSRSLITLIEGDNLLAGSLFEVALASDRIYHLIDTEDELANANFMLTKMNFGPLPMGNGLTRLESRFYGDTSSLEKVEEAIEESIDGDLALRLGLVTFAPDDIDYEDEVRLCLEERASFNPDALTGMEANYRFVGPETMETKIFSRLSAWQNWIFYRPNASGEEGALRRYGSGLRGNFNKERI
ncbi:MAG: 2,3-epoxybenzoyl-CoA dihydrolase [Actinomycetota bacterium]|nr:2,3-epoxybenzoyl-CoA dihydrolase [Actinomycetota bacterium]